MKNFIQKLPNLNAGGTLIAVFFTGMVVSFSFGHFSGFAKADGYELQKCTENNSKTHQDIEEMRVLMDSAVKLLNNANGTGESRQKNLEKLNKELKGEGLDQEK